ncbi:MAG: hypothetical protein WC586_08775 [Methanoregula sp.]
MTSTKETERIFPAFLSQEGCGTAVPVRMEPDAEHCQQGAAPAKTGDSALRGRSP